MDTRKFDDKVNEISLALCDIRCRLSETPKRTIQALRRKVQKLTDQDTTYGGTPRLRLALQEIDGWLASKEQG